MSIIEISHLNIVFGQKTKDALKLIKDGEDRASIKKKTGCLAAVKDASLSIKAGEIFSIMGLSGSGKSTLLKAINGLVSITSGEVNINLENEHFSLSKVDDKALRRLRTRHVSMVFQKFALLPWKTVGQNIAFGLEIAHADKAEIAKKIFVVNDGMLDDFSHATRKLFFGQSF